MNDALQALPKDKRGPEQLTMRLIELIGKLADTVAGAHASAYLYSLLQTCRVNGIDGYRYLRVLFIELPKAKTVDDYAALLPWRL
ncbi:transposase domain-containing protein [Aquabacterium sp. A7-Y]|uniref:transposase domain-containing protein n=1 Tax=Aquabacterium sp. A7-Y TaxID=1349605 RepID=UPI0039FD659A